MLRRGGSVRDAQARHRLSLSRGGRGASARAVTGRVGAGARRLRSALAAARK